MSLRECSDRRDTPEVTWSTPARESRSLGLSRATTAVVLAAGAGTRLRATTGNGDLPKPLTPVAGTPLIARTLGTLRSQGIDRAVVVTGYAAAAVEGRVGRMCELAGLDIQFARNPAWERQNGLSVLAARDLTNGAPFLLTMADHVYSGSIVAALRAYPADGAAAVLAVERRLETVRDIGDATRVSTGAGGHILGISKGLAAFDAVDTGVFLCRPALFDALEEERAERGGDCSLSDGIRRLARQGRALAADIPRDAWWQDVDTLEDLQLAELRMADSLARAS
jgi:choline kinase